MSADLVIWIIQFLHGLQFSMLLFLLSIGLSVIFGLLHFVNLAHGAFYALGAYICYSLSLWTGSFWWGFFGAPVVVAGIGFLLYKGLIKRMRSPSSQSGSHSESHSGPMNQVLITFGLIFIFVDLIRILWGDIALGVDQPALFSGPVEFWGISYSSYRLFIIAIGLLTMVILHLVLSRTQIGAIIRAGVDNSHMAACLGINVEKTFFMVFCFGCGLAGLAGAIAVPVFAATPDMGISILIPTLIVVVIGGLGSLKGAIVGSFLMGFLQTMGAVIAPELTAMLTYILLAAVLILKPNGLFPARN